MLVMTKNVTKVLGVLPSTLLGPAGIAVSVLRLAVLAVVLVDVVSETVGELTEKKWLPWWS
jgi:hypothetical protein